MAVKLASLLAHWPHLVKTQSRTYIHVTIGTCANVTVIIYMYHSDACILFSNSYLCFLTERRAKEHVGLLQVKLLT